MLKTKETDLFPKKDAIALNSISKKVLQGKIVQGSDTREANEKQMKRIIRLTLILIVLTLNIV